ncbi:hypothetical protein DSL72_002915 [Monilinia vaccinii-corymbosi]|uniref:Peptide N-acetyl-beta-D-glucosaminyl asparaginase amidase A N-terminal domain-containing protein n=1 Tax=Monilinia vaccinii-corymbosi TaxID=61207 RepID=A0A8A3PDQ9_9HELO|nr:hypothetical protein DSL72_002915 [Monilinia vaccinii-corymbosi]
MFPRNAARAVFTLSSTDQGIKAAVFNGPFSITSTAGVAPGLWIPIVGINGFDVKEYEIDIRTQLAIFCARNVLDDEGRAMTGSDMSVDMKPSTLLYYRNISTSSHNKCDGIEKSLYEHHITAIHTHAHAHANRKDSLYIALHCIASLIGTYTAPYTQRSSRKRREQEENL